MIGRVALPLLVLATLICSCSGDLSSRPSALTSENAPETESVWATLYDHSTNTSQLQAVLVARGAVVTSAPFEFTGLFVAGGTDPSSQLMFGELLSNDNPYSNPNRQLLVFHYDGNSARQLSATDVPLGPGQDADTIAVVPALNAVYLFSTVVGNESDDMPGQVLLFHYTQNGRVIGPIDVTPGFGITAVFSDLAYGEKTTLLYGKSFNFAHTEPGWFPSFATVRDGVPSSFMPFTPGDDGPFPSSVDVCFYGGSTIPLAYTRDGDFSLTYNSEVNAVMVDSVAGGVANFVSRTDIFGTDCPGPLLNGGALDEPHKAFYAAMQTLDPVFGTPVSAVLARFNFDPATGNIGRQPAQQIPIDNDDYIYVPRFGSRLFAFNSARVIVYTLTENGAQNPQVVPLAFLPRLLFGDTPLL